MEKCFADVMYPCGSALQIIWLEPQSHARIIGYFKVPAKHADQVLSQSGRQSAFFQIMQTDVDKENTKAKIRWLERGEQNAVRTPGFGLWSGLQRPQTKVGGAWSPICLEP